MLVLAEKTQCKRWIPLLFIIILSLFSFWWLLHDGLAWYDFPQQWKFGAYTFRGIDIYTLRGSNNFLPEIGNVGAGFHSIPWGLVMQNILYGGFLPYNTAVKYFIAVNILLLLVSSWILYEKVCAISKDLGIYAFIMSVLSVDFLIGLHAGNAGAAVCALMVMAWALRNDHEYISGICAGIAMIKPQIALIVCFAFLLHKNFKSLFTAAAVDIAGWIASALVLKKGFLELLYEFFSASERQTGFYRGIFHLLFEDYAIAIAMSMAAGIIFVILMYMYLPEDTPSLFKAYPACMSVTFWCYSYSTDCYILIIPAVICIWLMLHDTSRHKRLFWFISAVYCINAVSTWSRLHKILERCLGTSWYVSRTIHETGLVILSVIICLELRRIYSEVKA